MVMGHSKKQDSETEQDLTLNNRRTVHSQTFDQFFCNDETNVRTIEHME